MRLTRLRTRRCKSWSTWQRPPRPRCRHRPCHRRRRLHSHRHHHCNRHHLHGRRTRARRSLAGRTSRTTESSFAASRRQLTPKQRRHHTTSHVQHTGGATPVYTGKRWMTASCACGLRARAHALLTSCTQWASRYLLPMRYIRRQASQADRSAHVKFRTRRGGLIRRLLKRCDARSSRCQASWTASSISSGMSS